MRVSGSVIMAVALGQIFVWPECSHAPLQNQKKKFATVWTMIVMAISMNGSLMHVNSVGLFPRKFVMITTMTAMTPSMKN